MNKSITKTLIKGTFLVLVFSLFLRIDYKTFFNYLIFLSIFYLFLFLYIFFKLGFKYNINADCIEIIYPLKLKTLKIKYNLITDIFYNSGFLQKRFNLYTIYIINKRKNIMIKDINDPDRIIEKINYYKNLKL